jgi:hypothetical protein
MNIQQPLTQFDTKKNKEKKKHEYQLEQIVNQLVS